MTLGIDVEFHDEPELEFASGGRARDPKHGLARFGPLSFGFGPAHPPQVRVGLVGPRGAVEQAQAWFQRCVNSIPSASPRVALYPEFPGFTRAFRSDLIVDRRWAWTITDAKLKDALGADAPRKRFDGVLRLYSEGLRELHKAGPAVIVACLPAEVIHECRVVRAAPLSAQEKARHRRQQAGQLALPGMGEDTAIEDTLLHRDFRRALKARAMDIGIPIQIGTERLFLDTNDNQDAATRAWNVSVALFYKASGQPWRLHATAPETCHVGISFHHLRTRLRHAVFASLAQAFSTSGDGFVLRGERVPSKSDAEDRHPHLTAAQAERLAKQVREQYVQRAGFDPPRVVLYKTTQFDDAEQQGFRRALVGIPVVEMVHLRPAEFRLVRRGAFPPRRGTIANVGEACYLFTNGYYPDWQTYMGAHVPVPYEVRVVGSTDPRLLCGEILGLTKLNWNAARPFGSVPIPLLFAREVGSIMSHYAELKGDLAEPDPSYAFYM